MQIRLQFSGDKTSKGLVAAGILAAELLQDDGTEFSTTDLAIGQAIAGGTLKSVLFVGTLSATLQQDPLNFVFDNYNNFLGIDLGGVAPTDTLHLDGSLRLDNTLLPSINLKFGTSATGTEGGLIQLLEAGAYGTGNGAMLCGLGWSNASWGWTENGIILNSGKYVAFGSANIQASLDELFAIHGCTGVPDNAVGNNNDFMFRKDGFGGNSIYQKNAGTWQALV